MTKTLTFWFDPASTYSYLSALRLPGLAAERGVDVIWQPFLLGPIFVAQGWTSSPFNIYPRKGAYMWRDLQRQAQAQGLPLVRPDTFPQNSLMAARVALAALAVDPQDKGPAFCQALYAAQFGQGGDITDPQTLRDALEQAGLDPDLTGRAGDPDVKQALKDAGQRANDLGLFGAPSFTVGTELFWGDDRLEQALDWAARG